MDMDNSKIFGLDPFMEPFNEGDELTQDTLEELTDGKGDDDE